MGVVPFERDSGVTLCQGIWAAMQWSPLLKARASEVRVDFNRRLSVRYSPVEFLEANARDWEDTCSRLVGGPYAVPFVWRQLLKELRRSPRLLDHLTACAHAPPPREDSLPPRASL